MSINLLSWRDLEFKKNKNQLKTLFMSASLIGLIIIGVGYVFLNHQLTRQQERVAYLNKKISSLDEAINIISTLEAVEEKLLNRIKMIQNLQENRPNMVKVFDAIARAVPKDTHLTLLQMKQNSLIITGVTKNNHHISEIMRILDRSVLFDNPNLISVNALASGLGSRFELSVKQVLPPATLNAGDST